MDHDSHVKAYHRYQIRIAVQRAAVSYVVCRYEMAARGLDFTRQTRSGWTWRNHVANWINKTLNLLEKWGL